jgi:serine/threonine protein phosphatase PrpC
MTHPWSDTDRELRVQGATETGTAAKTPPLRADSFGMTERGLVRPTNQDQFLIATLTKAMRIRQSSLPQARAQYGDEAGNIFLVADGMGGEKGGERASALAVRTIEDFLLNALKWFFHLRGPEKDNVVAEFQEAFARADAELFREAVRHPELEGMGTTLTMAYALDADLFVVHAGDSRAYLFRTDELDRLTQDHTLAGEMVRQGTLRPEQAEHHRLRHVVTNAIGGHSQGLTAEVHKLRLEPGDRLLLASDGLTGMVSDEEIAEVLRHEQGVRPACEQLVSRALGHGGHDNVTVIVADFGEPD